MLTNRPQYAYFQNLLPFNEESQQILENLTPNKIHHDQTGQYMFEIVKLFELFENYKFVREVKI